MVPHFIEVHADGIPYSINLETLGFFGEYGGRLKLCTGEIAITLDESYDEVKALIRHAGCQITKADPRLDTSHPVPWEELVKAEMVGQPVWNSNSRRWMLLIDSDGPYTRGWITLLNDQGGTEKWIEHDAQRFPLYRMRQ